MVDLELEELYLRLGTAAWHTVSLAHVLWLLALHMHKHWKYTKGKAALAHFFFCMYHKLPSKYDSQAYIPRV